ncbi:hypothetical protein PanWU01x14_242190 [Parasponia andersonii]|uniref:Uncharacterized protein n=1 Tax=Parasponia andersonii TaxID=3476 RepID=A0A2P5BG51_PARAD|nr:hypothetical protein PanWU01x14_242190 [Parasponia andersonii]
MDIVTAFGVISFASSIDSYICCCYDEFDFFYNLPIIDGIKLEPHLRLKLLEQLVIRLSTAVEHCHAFDFCGRTIIKGKDHNLDDFSYPEQEDIDICVLPLREGLHI